MKRFLILLAACFLHLSLSAQTTTYLWSNGATTPTINVNPSVTTKYYVTITQDGVEYYDSLVVMVNSNQNKATISPSAVTSVCLNNAMAAITYTTTGATGIGTATGLPEGVSAAWSDNTITISGTPTESGTFNYSIPLTGGCGTVNATGTLTVTAPIVPSFTQVGPFVSGKSISALPTTSTNGVSGTWSPAISNTATTTYTFTPAAEQCASTTTMTITINEPLQYTLTASDNSVCAGTTVTLSVSIPSTYPAGTVHCNGTPTAIVDVTNPVTGKTWMDRNLGASQVATSSTDAAAYGDLYQWGRGADGHQCRNSATTSTLSSSDQPGHVEHIKVSDLPFDWRSPQNDNLWQGVNSVNNPCPSGYRLPTDTELNNERLSWLQAPISSSNNSVGAFSSPLKLPLAGIRDPSPGFIFNVGSNGVYWSSTISGSDSRYLSVDSSASGIGTYMRAVGLSVRCLRD